MKKGIHLVMFTPISHNVKELIRDDCPLMPVKSLIIAGFQSWWKNNLISDPISSYHGLHECPRQCQTDHIAAA